MLFRIGVIRPLFVLLAVCCGLIPLARVGYGQRLAFQLPDSSGKLASLSQATHELTVVCFLGTECPMAKAYVPTLNRLQREYLGAGLRVVGVMSNRQDSVEDIAKYVETLGVEFEVLKDAGNAVADQYGAERTPEAFLLDKDLRLRYRGRIDDQFAPSVARNAARQQDLKAAIDELLAGKPVSIPTTRALGCIIGRVKSSKGYAEKPQKLQGQPTFADDVMPVLERNCMECHRSGEIGPFSMERYEEVVGWADTMLETIDEGRMPPWHADPDFGEFANERHMDESDKQLFRQWIEAGCPSGDLESLPIAQAQDDGWLFSPDLVMAMRERPFTVPATGIVEYQYFVVDPGFQEDKWVTAAQVIPGKRDVVHHAIVFVRPPDGVRSRGVGWLTAYVPGQRSAALPKGYARRVPAGSKLVFQMHYTPNGIERKDASRVGLQFADAADVTHEVYTTVALNQDFDIPPNDPNFLVRAEVRGMPSTGALLAVTPHMHYRGKSCTVLRRAERDGDADSTETLLRVPDYDFNWQHTYQFLQPLSLSKDETYRIEVAFDNSDENPFNPNPEEWVYWGDQTFEEMALAFFEVAIPLKTPRSGKNQSLADKGRSIDRQKVEAYVERVFEALDKNGDSLIHKSEGSIFVRKFNFYLFDRDRNGVATKEEVRSAAERLYKN